MRSLVILIVCSICFFTSNAQQFKLSDFVETPPSKYPEKEWLELNRMPISFKVDIVNGVLTIKKDKEYSQIQLDIGGNKLIGLNHGEWGGSLLYKANRLPVDTIKSGNIVGIFKIEDQIYFLEGLAHMSFNKGSLYKLYKKGSKFTYAKVLDFKDAPEAYSVYKNEMLVAGHNNFYVVKNDKSYLLFEDMFWESLYPNSVAALNDYQVYLGIRGGFVELNTSNKTFKFYRYKHVPKVTDP